MNWPSPEGPLVTPSGSRRAGTAVQDGRVVAIADDELLPPARTSYDASDKLLLPRLVDPEEQPGVYVPMKDDLASVSRAAAVAGVSTWRIQAPSPRMGHPRFAEFVQAKDAISFHETFAHIVALVESDAVTDVFVTYMPETMEQVAEIPEYAREHGVASYKLHMAAMVAPADPKAIGRRTGFGHGFDYGLVFSVMRAVVELGSPGLVINSPVVRMGPG